MTFVEGSVTGGPAGKEKTVTVRDVTDATGCTRQLVQVTWPGYQTKGEMCIRDSRTCGEGGCAGRVLYRKWPGVVVVGRIMSCSGVVLVPVGGLWQCPGAAHGHRGQAVWTLRRSMHRRWWGCARKSSPCALETPQI